MSLYFRMNERTVWNPASDVGRIYTEYVRVLEKIYGHEAGLTDTSADLIEIESQLFTGFANALLGVLGTSNHRILHLELRSVLVPSIVMLQRAGIPSSVDIGDVEFGKDVELFGRSMPT
jgi:hypothetical protein